MPVQATLTEAHLREAYEGTIAASVVEYARNAKAQGDCVLAILELLDLLNKAALNVQLPALSGHEAVLLQLQILVYGYYTPHIVELCTSMQASHYEPQCPCCPNASEAR